MIEGVINLTPENEALRKTEGHWYKIVALLLAKLNIKEISFTDLEMTALGAANMAVVLDARHNDRITLRLVTMAEAFKLAAGEKSGNT